MSYAIYKDTADLTGILIDNMDSRMKVLGVIDTTVTTPNLFYSLNISSITDQGVGTTEVFPTSVFQDVSKTSYGTGLTDGWYSMASNGYLFKISSMMVRTSSDYAGGAVGDDHGAIIMGAGTEAGYNDAQTNLYP